MSFAGEFTDEEEALVSTKFTPERIGEWTFWRYKGGFHCHHVSWDDNIRIFGSTIKDMMANLMLKDIMR